MDADVNANANAGGSTIVLRELCSGELKMKFFLSCLPDPLLITEDSTKQDLSDIQLALFSLKMVCVLNNDTMQKENHI